MVSQNFNFGGLYLRPPMDVRLGDGGVGQGAWSSNFPPSLVEFVPALGELFAFKISTLEACISGPRGT